MEKIGTEVVNNLQLLIQSKNGMSESIEARKSDYDKLVKDVANGLKHYPSYIRDIKSKLPVYCKIPDGCKCQFNDVDEAVYLGPINVDLTDVGDLSEMFRYGNINGRVLISPKSFTCDYMFADGLCEFHFDGDTSGVQSINYMYAYNTGYGLGGGEVYIRRNDFSNVTSMEGFAYEAYCPTSCCYLDIYVSDDVDGDNEDNPNYGKRILDHGITFFDTSNVTNFRYAFSKSHVAGQVLNLNSATDIEGLFKDAKFKKFRSGVWDRQGYATPPYFLTPAIRLFGDPSNITNMEGAFDYYDDVDDHSVLYTDKIYLRYDPRYDYSHIINEASKKPFYIIEPMTEEDMEIYFEIYPHWR